MVVSPSYVLLFAMVLFEFFNFLHILFVCNTETNAVLYNVFNYWNILFQKKKFSISGTYHSNSFADENHEICPICFKSFSNNRNLKRHMKTHVGERRFLCSVCQKGFTRKDYLECHMRIHTGERPFKCSACDFECNQKSSLRRHFEKHQ